MPHNKYQHAEYPEDEGGDEHVRRKPEDVRPGLSNQLGSHLFRDTIVKAAPGFNAGTGRHIRAQEGLDWERNWETHRESRTGRIPKSDRFPRNGHQVRRSLHRPEVDPSNPCPGSWQAGRITVGGGVGAQGPGRFCHAKWRPSR